jgi:HSP20 family protein
MTTHRHSGFVPAGALSREIDRVIQDFWRAFPTHSGLSVFNGHATPPVNVRETPDRFEAELELPGLSLSDIEVVVKGRELTIRGQRAAPQHDGATWHRRERAFGNFSRMLHLPAEIDGDKVQARLDQGVLTIVLPKSEGARARKIPIATLHSGN